MPRTVWLRHELSLAHDVPGHPERPARIVALEAAMEREGWFGCELREAPEASQDSLRAVHPERHIRYIDELSARGGGRVDMDTIAVAATYDAALRAAGGGVALRRRAADAARPRPASRRCARRVTTPRPTARWASASSATRRWRRAMRHRHTAPSAC